MVLLKPLLSLLIHLSQIFDMPKSEVPCRIPIRLHQKKRK